MASSSEADSHGDSPIRVYPRIGAGPGEHRKYPENSDISAKRQEYFFRPPAWLDGMITRALKDKRDLPLAYLFFNITAVTIPGAALVFYFQSNWFGFLFWLTNFVLFQERFSLGLHIASHRSMTDNPIVNQYPSVVLAPFFGVPSGIYYLHHCVMHHVENNINDWDLSSTEPYQRDNLLHFFYYYLRFLLAIWVELPYYAYKRNRTKETVLTIASMCLYWTVIITLMLHNPCGTFWVFAVPAVAGSFALMFGNWSQHIFVDPDKPRCNYHLTYNIINADFNQRTFNDGYHLEHHVNSRRHWTELPSNFMNNVSQYVKEDAIVFQGLDFMAVGVLVFLGKYKVLTKHFVHLGSSPRTPLEVEALLRARLVPIRPKAKST